MDLSHIIAFNVTLLVAILVPGPSLIYLTQRTLRSGRATGVVTALGLGLMSALWMLAALAGLDGLFRLFPWAFLVLKTGGAIYLIHIAIRTWKNARSEVSESPAPRARSAFLGGMLVNLANPKSIFFAAAVILVIFPSTITTVERSLIFFNHLAVEWMVQPTLAVLLSTTAVRRGYLRLKPLFDRTAAVILGGLGLRLLVGRS